MGDESRPRSSTHDRGSLRTNRAERIQALQLVLALVVPICAGVLSVTCCLAADSIDGPMTLSDAVRLGLENDPEIRQAEIELHIAGLELDAELSSFFLPTVSLTVTPPNLTSSGWTGGFSGSVTADLSLPIGTSSQLRGKLAVESDAATGSWSASGWSLSLSQCLAVAQPETALDSVDRRRNDVANAEAALRQARSDLIIDVTRSYLNLLSATDGLKRAERALDEAEESLRRACEAFDAGLVGETHVIEARICALDAEIAVEDRAESLEEVRNAFFGEALGSVEPSEMVPPAFAVDRMFEAVRSLLQDEGAILDAVASSSSVAGADESLASAEETLARSRLVIDPQLTIHAGLSENGLTIGWSSSLTVFSPCWSEEIEIARLQVELASERLRSAKRQVESSIRSDLAALKAAARDVDRLPLEEERWTLEEEVMRAKHDAGTIGEREWSDFLDQLESFRLEANERSTTLFVALIGYRYALGFPLEWEEWLE